MSSIISDSPQDAKSMEDKFAKHRGKFQQLLNYYMDDDLPDLPPNELRNIKNQLKTHSWDAESMLTWILIYSDFIKIMTYIYWYYINADFLHVHVNILSSAEKEIYMVGKKNDMKKKVVMEWQEMMDILKLYHSSNIGGHSGVNTTLGKVSANYTWTGIKEYVQEYVSQPQILMPDVLQFDIILITIIIILITSQ